MGIIKRGILSGFSGNVSIINGYKHYKKQCIRLKSTVRKDAQSSVQLLNRELFKQVNGFCNPIYFNYIRHSLKFAPGLASPFFKFYKYNYNKFDANGLIHPDTLITSIGNLLPVEDFVLFDFDAQGNSFFSWTNNADNIKAFDNDILFGFAYCPALESIQLFESNPLRSEELIIQQYPLVWFEQNAFYFYVSFIKYNNLDISNNIIYFLD